jgi:D-lactate dehydrogenase
MVSIAFFEIRDWEESYLKERLKPYKLLFFEEPLTEKNISKARKFDGVSVRIYSKLTKELLDEMQSLKAIFTRSTGYDHIDMKACQEKNIKVFSVPSYGENTVAEHTFALILSLSRNIHKSYLRTMKNDFRMDDLTGFDLKGKTIGIVGGGRIGMHVARIAKSFGMKVLVYDINQQPFMAEVLGFEYKPMEELLSSSDIVSLHVPYNEQTHHLIDEKKIRMMKKGAIIINTSRGGVLDTDALAKALEKKHLGGAGLDVIEGEEIIRDENELMHCQGENCKWKPILERNEKLFHMDNVVFTPHNAFNSKEALIRILDTTIDNINQFFRKNNNI